MQEGGLEFKGLKEGLYAVYKGTGGFEDFLAVLEDKLNNSGKFFAGAHLAGVYGIDLDDIERDILIQILGGKYGIKMKQPFPSKKTPSWIDCRDEDGDTSFVYSTLRSGQRVASGGNVVVLGDVNAGAEVEAGGNIVVMGTLRGSARAGMPDNYRASVSAIILHPTQLRIGGITVRWPDEKRHVDEPEIAYIEDGKMYVRPVGSAK